MSNQVLRDRHGIKIGEIREQGGKLIIYDAHNIKRGEYDSRLDVTRDSHGIKVGEGNLLSSLL